jgi:hypothetical protein
LHFEIDSGRINLQPVSETACTESTLDVGTQNKHDPGKREGECLEEVQPFVRLEKGAASVIVHANEASGRPDRNVLLRSDGSRHHQCG